MNQGDDQPGYLQLLDPDALGKIHRLELIARGVVEGFISGRHKSPYKGFSAEFAEHREYVPGDNIRDLDWRVFGRTDRYFIKQYIEETNLRALVLLDCSGSMRYAGRLSARHQGRQVSKFRYGQFLAASLAHLMINQQDAVGLATFDVGLRRYIPARSRPSHLRVILEELAASEPGQETRLAPVFHDLAERVHRRGLVIIISDLFDDAGEILKALHHFRYRKHEVLLLHVMAEEELNFPFDRWSLFRSLERQGHQVQLDPLSIRSDYLARVREFIGRIQVGCGQMDVDYVQLSTRSSFDLALSHYLAGRMSRAR
jgi:uncharacterized protein (DUF58 family)